MKLISKSGNRKLYAGKESDSEVLIIQEREKFTPPQSNRGRWSNDRVSVTLAEFEIIGERIYRGTILGSRFKSLMLARKKEQR